MPKFKIGEVVVHHETGTLFTVEGHPDADGVISLEHRSSGIPYRYPEDQLAAVMPQAPTPPAVAKLGPKIGPMEIRYVTMGGANLWEKVEIVAVGKEQFIYAITRGEKSGAILGFDFREVVDKLAEAKCDIYVQLLGAKDLDASINVILAAIKDGKIRHVKGDF